MENSDKYTVQILSEAANDMSEIVSQFVMLGSVSGAVKMKESFLRAMEQLSIFPYSGITAPDAKLAKMGFRMLIIGNYLMLYRIFDGEKRVIIYRIFNGKTNYPTILKRLNDELK